MNILGINMFFEHPAVALVRDGILTFAIEDERLTRIKHGKRYTPYRTYIPYDAIHLALAAEGLRARDLDEIAFSYSRRQHLASLWGCLNGERNSSLYDEISAYRSLVNIRHAIAGGYELPIKYRERLPPEELRCVPRREWDHHLSHAASAFFCSGFDAALVVVSDGSGERASTSVYEARGCELHLMDRMNLPHSLGLFYTYVTIHLGFEPFSDEYKVMGLAAYGEPRFAREMEDIVRLLPHGQYRMNKALMRDMSCLFGPPRHPDGPLEQAHKDLARSAQLRLEVTIEHVVRHHMLRSGLRALCLAGGTFLNCAANGYLGRSGVASDIYVQPASHDAGTAIGAAALSWARRGGGQLQYESMFLGRQYDHVRIEAVLRQASVPYQVLDEPLAVALLARLLATEKIVALFRGRMEFGPRSLGNRSILASPCSVWTRAKLNVLKNREQFRPLAPIVTAEAFDTFFEGVPNRYMMFTVRVRGTAREQIPAVVHVDGTARVQVVHREHDPFLHAVLEAFAKQAGPPVLINTSLNVRGCPIDESPHDALASFFTSGLDALFLGQCLVQRQDLHGG